MAIEAKKILSYANKDQLDLKSVEFANYLDLNDPLREFRNEFRVPLAKDSPKTDPHLLENEDEEVLYFNGNSLGLMPKTTEAVVGRQMDRWSKYAAVGHTHGELAWAFCDEQILEPMLKIIGAKLEETAFMNALSVNIHLLLLSFYNPTPKRHKILMEGKAFPSDFYIVASQIKLRGFNPEESLISVQPREGEHCIRDEDIFKTIEEEGEEIAVIWFSGVHYFTGQLFDMKKITEAGQRKGCYVGFDLAHAVGNVELALHDWGVDFACWCTYKYLNSGPGSCGGAFVHEKHFGSINPALEGWWSHDYNTRFGMDCKRSLCEGVSAWRISNPSGILAAVLKSSLLIFDKTSMAELRQKSKLLTAYFEYLLTEMLGDAIIIITPSNPEKRGAQLSLLINNKNPRTVFYSLEKRGVILDYREPNVLRMAPVPLYNSFKDIFLIVQKLRKLLID